MKTILAIDPGIKGAAAWFYGNELQEIISFQHNKNWRADLFFQIRFKQPHQIFVENVHSFPGQGVKSMMTFGRQIEAVHTTIDLAGYSPTLISPQLWQRQLGLLGKDKKVNKKLALKLFPQLEGIKGDVYDAVLIGYAAKLNET